MSNRSGLGRTILALSAFAAALAAATAAIAGAVAVDSAPPVAAGRLTHTYSIVARDSTTGEMGVAVQSHWFAVGPVVPWAEAGVGAVATQSLVNVSYGPLALQMLRLGKTPQEALTGLLASDAGADLRQVAVIDAQGRVAAHTGQRCIPEAGHRIGAGYSVQANLMLRNTVWPAMAAAFETATGDLAERLLQALEAAEAEGGDIRGRQSAALVVVAPERTDKPWEARRLDLRVDDSAAPLVELRRLLKIHRAYEHMNKGDEALGHGDTPGAMREYAAAADFYPENLEIRYWQAVTMCGAGLLEEALPIFGEIFQAEPNWRILTPRLRRVQLLEVTEADLERILIQKATNAE
jgi:uncharacterized Ntn-hydrolase superfamily protein